MKKETKILKADHNPIKVGDNVLVDVKTKTKKHEKPTSPSPDSDNNGKKTPRPPVWFVGAIQEALSPIRSDVQNINARLDEQGRDIKTINIRLSNLENRVTKFESR